jgi:hypothetical protein
MYLQDYKDVCKGSHIKQIIDNMIIECFPHFKRVLLIPHAVYLLDSSRGNVPICNTKATLSWNKIRDISLLFRQNMSN